MLLVILCFYICGWLCFAIEQEPNQKIFASVNFCGWLPIHEYRKYKTVKKLKRIHIYIHTLHTLYIHHTYTVHTLYIHCTYTVYSHLVSSHLTVEAHPCFYLGIILQKINNNLCFQLQYENHDRQKIHPYICEQL